MPEFIAAGDGMEVSSQQIYDHTQVYNEGRNVHREKRNKQKMLEIHDNRNKQADYQSNPIK